MSDHPRAPQPDPAPLADEIARDFIERRGYRRCDIAACNCNSWHGGHAENRLGEIHDALDAAGVEMNGKTIIGGVHALIAEITRLINERDTAVTDAVQEELMRAEAAEAALTTLRAELEQLQKENEELKARMDTMGDGHASRTAATRELT